MKQVIIKFNSILKRQLESDIQQIRSHSYLPTDRAINHKSHKKTNRK
jgi:hypothetical protein